MLSTILGLEIWDTYKERTAEKRKLIESDVQEIDGRVAEIDSELAEEEARKSRLAELENTLKQLSSAREVQESALENIRKNAALINEQRKLAETLSTSLERARASLANLETRLAEKETERAAYADLGQPREGNRIRLQGVAKSRARIWKNSTRRRWNSASITNADSPCCARSKWKRRSWSRNLKCSVISVQ